MSIDKYLSEVKERWTARYGRTYNSNQWKERSKAELDFLNAAPSDVEKLLELVKVYREAFYDLEQWVKFNKIFRSNNGEHQRILELVFISEALSKAEQIAGEK